jgi:intein-encoded DNA endonuclease-like protein
MGYFAPTKIVNAHELYPNEYYKHFYFNKPLCDGIELVAEIEKINKKKASQNLIKRGFSSWMGEKVKNHIDNEKSARELDQKIKLTRFR